MYFFKDTNGNWIIGESVDSIVSKVPCELRRSSPTTVAVRTVESRILLLAPIEVTALRKNAAGEFYATFTEFIAAVSDFFDNAPITAEEVDAKIGAEVGALSERIDTVENIANASTGGSLGSIKPTDAAPTPARNGNYTFSIGGNKPAWLTAEAGVTTVKAGDGVAVVFTAPSSYTYTHINVAFGVEQVRSKSTGNVPSSNLFNTIASQLDKVIPTSETILFEGSVTNNQVITLPIDTPSECVIKYEVMTAGTVNYLYLNGSLRGTIVNGFYITSLFKHADTSVKITIQNATEIDIKITALATIGLINTYSSILLRKYVKSRGTFLLSDYENIETGDKIELKVSNELESNDSKYQYYIYKNTPEGTLLGVIYEDGRLVVDVTSDLTAFYINPATGSSNLVLTLSKLPKKINAVYNVDAEIELSTGFYTKSTARLAIPTFNRIPNLIVTYKTSSEDVVTEEYIGTLFTDAEWENDSNWETILKTSDIDILQGNIDKLYDTEAIELLNDTLAKAQVYTLPTDISDTEMIYIEILSDLDTVTFYANTTAYYYTGSPIALPYYKCKLLHFDTFTGTEIDVKITKLKSYGLLNKTDNRLVYRGLFGYSINISEMGLSAGDTLLVQNTNASYTTSPIQVYLYKNTLGGTLISAVYPLSEYKLMVPDDMTSLVISIPGGGTYNSEVLIYKVNESSNEMSQLVSTPLSAYDWVAAGDSITAWNSSTDTGVVGVEKFNGWANLLNAQIGFKSYLNIAVPGSSYIQSSLVGGYTYSIARTLLNLLPLQFEGILTIMGATNDYGATLGSAAETIAKTYDTLNTRNQTANQLTVCDGFRFCLESAIRRCSWRAKIFVITCVPRNTSGSYTVADMNEQIKLIAKSFNVPVIDMFSELNLRNGFDQFGGTWKLSEFSDGISSENVHPNEYTQKRMMQYIFGKLRTFIG